MDNISKALRKFNEKERRVIKEILLKVKQGDTKGLDIQKLIGHSDIYRMRKGRIRVIIQRREDGGFSVLAVDRRSEKTYRGF